MNAKEFLEDYDPQVKENPQGHYLYGTDKVIERMEAYHRAKVEAVTDEEIEKAFPSEYSEDGTYLENIEAQRGVKWLRNKLLNQ